MMCAPPLSDDAAAGTHKKPKSGTKHRVSKKPQNIAWSGLLTLLLFFLPLLVLPLLCAFAKVLGVSCLATVLLFVVVLQRL